jgi:hypothetical protein
MRRARGVGLYCCNQGHALPCLFELAIHTEMVAAKRAGACDSNPNGRPGYFPAPLPSTACRQRL